MKIFIATGIFPPDIGGPAQYAKNLQDEFRTLGHSVSVKSFELEKKLPTGFRHALYLARVALPIARADVVFALDTFSAALPALLAAKLFRKKLIVRTGGDFLWESYVERTGDLVLFKNFYTTSIGKLSLKEKLVFSLTGWVLKNASVVIFSTSWQKDIFSKAYRLDPSKMCVVENYYGQKEASFLPAEKNFIAGTRPLKWKNDARLAEAFSQVLIPGESVVYDNATRPFEAFMEKLARAYAIILVSLGDISPNLILDAIRHNKPFIVTRETGLYERIKECALFVDPENVENIAEKIRWLSDPKNYEEQKKKVEAFTFTHTWADIAREFLIIAGKV